MRSRLTARACSLRALAAACCAPPALMLLLLPSFAAPAHATTDRAQLRARLVGKIVTLRRFTSASFSKYDPSGTLTTRAPLGPWTLYSRLQITSLDLAPGKLEMAGSRIFVVFRAQPGGARKMALIRTEQAVSLQVSLLPNEDPGDVINRIFLGPDESLADLVPPYWRPYFASQPALAGPGAHPQNAPSVTGPPPTTSSPNDHPAAHADPNTPPGNSATNDLKVTPGAMQGALLHGVEPRYPELARAAHITGSVVLRARIGPDGAVQNLIIARPAGAGLDEAAIEAVSQWRYRPYRINGSPMEVETIITVNFHLH